MRRAARRGVDVRLILQGEPDMPIVKTAASMLYDHLLRAGVHIYEYCERPLHGKVALVDDDWRTVGSSNLDPLSLSLNLEANVVLRDRAFTDCLRGRLQHLIDHDCRPARVPPPSRWSLWPQLRSAFVFHFLRHFSDLGRLAAAPCADGSRSRSRRWTDAARRPNRRSRRSRSPGGALATEALPTPRPVPADAGRRAPARPVLVPAAKRGADDRCSSSPCWPGGQAGPQHRLERRLDRASRLPAGTLLLAAGFAAASHALYSSYDLFGRHETGHRLPPRRWSASPSSAMPST